MAHQNMPLDSPQKSLDRKLAAIHADPFGCKEFILADAKDADMGFGVTAPGVNPRLPEEITRFRTLAEYRENMRKVVRSGLVDIMLMSASSSEVLTIQERLFDNSSVTPAARANDTTDIHLHRGGKISLTAARPFRTAFIDHIQAGKLNPTTAERERGANLGLYSVTFNNDADCDRETLTEYRRFREEAEAKKFRHFMEVFDPNLPGAVAPEQVGPFINDAIARTLAGVPSAGRPIFLKIVYHGPRWMEELVQFDPHLVVGILGGSSGTTRDAFQLIHDAQKYGARAALFGRKINSAEDQVTFIRFLRRITDGEIGPVEAVRAYHGELESLGIIPRRNVAEDLELTESVLKS
jgi:hypothetical protein